MASRVTPLRIEKRTSHGVSIADCSSVSSLEEDCGSAEYEDMSTSPDTSYRSSADADKSFDLEEDFREKLNKFDDIIEKIENLRFDLRNEDEDDANENVGTTRRDVAAGNENIDNLEYRHADNEDVNNNESNENNGSYLRTLNVRSDECRGEQRASPQEDDRDDPVDQSRGQEDTDDPANLIERGPIKPEVQPLRRHPYSMVSWLSRAGDVANVDYDKTAEQILRNKDFSEKLNPCLDQLSNSSREQSSIGTILGVPGQLGADWIAENADDVYRSGDPANDTAALPSIIINDPDEQSLMDILSRGGFQAAVLSDAGSHSIPSPSAKTWSSCSPASSHNCNVVSRSNSRASSRAQSPGSAGTNLESPQMHVNVIGSPLGSPQVGSTYRVPLSSSSSSSNQSYGDASSPLNYQTPVSYQQEEQLGECLSDWRSSTYDSSGTIVNSSDDIDMLQLVEQIIEEDEQGCKALGEPQLASSAPPCFSSGYGSRCASMREPLASDPRPHRIVERATMTTMTTTTDKPEIRANVPSPANPDVIGRLPIDGGGGLVSVYMNKENPGRCTFANRTVEPGHHHEPRYYQQPAMKVNLTQQNGPHASARTSERNPCASQERYAMYHDGERRFNQPSSSRAFVPADYQIPTMVPSFVSGNPQRNPPSRGIVPWPSLNMPSVRASERLKEGLHPKEVERAMSNLLKKSIEELAAADEDGDTKLMCLVSNPEELTKKKAYLAPLVERLGNMPTALSTVNNRGEDALYLAAINCPEMPYVTGYLAAAILQKGIDISQKLYHIRGDTLIHSLAARGDSHGEVLAELLALKTLQGNPVFDLSKCNYDGRTALHTAVASHDPVGRGVKSLATTRLLLENGADPKVKENKCGDTALHIAASLNCDPVLLKVLLCKATSNVNEINYMYNTPLHMAAAVSGAVSLDRQKEVCRLLIQAGAQTNIQNRQGKTPLALVSSDRKEAIKRIFYKKS